MLELAVLGLLKEQPLHGYELKKRLGETLGFLWGVSYGSLYPALRRLERAGAIEAVEPGPATPIPSTGSLTGDLAAARLRRRPRPGRRTRKQYAITPGGEALFAELLAADGGPGPDDERTFALKLAFCRHLPAADRLAFLERRRAELADRLHRARGETRSRDRYLHSLMEHRTRTTERDLEWVEELIQAEHPAEPTPGERAVSERAQGERVPAGRVSRPATSEPQKEGVA
jgi:DNA-binding PadR family transcriptional regulator